MYISCASVCYRHFYEDEIDGMIADASKAGYKFVELQGPKTWSPEGIDAFNPEEMKYKLDAAGLKCTSIYPPGFGGRDDADIELRAHAMAKACKHAEYLGCDFLDTAGMAVREEDNTSALNRTVKMINRVLELTPNSKVMLGMENHNNFTIMIPSDYDYILERIKNPRVGINVDTGIFHAAGVNTIELIYKHKDRIFGVHFKDHAGLSSVGIGRGDVDFPAIINALKDIGYSRGLTVELEHKDKENTLYYVREALAYLSGLLGRKIC